MNDLLRQIKQDFFAYRNGIVADMLRKSGDPHEFIMGCQIADINSISQRYPTSVDLADALWQEEKHRECRLASIMIHPKNEFPRDKAMRWINKVETCEIADILCHRLLKHQPYATLLWETLANDESEMKRYVGFRLLLNLICAGIVQPHEKMRDIIMTCPPLSQDFIQLQKRLLEELDEINQPK